MTGLILHGVGPEGDQLAGHFRLVFFAPGNVLSQIQLGTPGEQCGGSGGGQAATQPRTYATSTNFEQGVVKSCHISLRSVLAVRVSDYVVSIDRARTSLEYVRDHSAQRCRWSNGRYDDPWFRLVAFFNCCELGNGPFGCGAGTSSTCPGDSSGPAGVGVP